MNAVMLWQPLVLGLQASDDAKVLAIELILLWYWAACNLLP
jgi:hypothetical protein